MAMLFGKELNQEFIHYGSVSFRRESFDPVRDINFGLTKPMGGLWGCPVNDPNDWKAWCKNEGVRRCNFNIYFKFKLKDDAKVFVLDKNIKELEILPSMFNEQAEIYKDEAYIGVYKINFQKSSKLYDAIYVANNEVFQSVLEWSCNSILVMNPDVVEEIR